MEGREDGVKEERGKKREARRVWPVVSPRERLGVG